MDTAPVRLRTRAVRLDPREEHFRIPGPDRGQSLFLRRLAPRLPAATAGKAVLYVHGGTFPSGLSIAHRFDGRAWRDDLVDAGFDVWGLDFYGFGSSDPYPKMARPAAAEPPLGRTESASRQLAHAVRFICAERRVPRISIIAHSWGTIVAGRFAGESPDLVDRMVFFGPIARRPRTSDPVRYPAWRLVSLEDQWRRFTAEVPAGEAAVLSRRHFEDWGEAYLDSDPESRTREPFSVKTPAGPWQDIADAAAGALAYDPALVRAPVAIIRGEWDSLATDSDAAWLFDALSGSALKRDVKIGRATHLMHLEERRFALYREAQAFLAGNDTRPV